MHATINTLDRTSTVIHIWLKSLIILAILYVLLFGLTLSNILNVKDIATYSVIAFILAASLNLLLLKSNQSIAYILFFSVTFTTILGLTKTLTGSPSSVSSLYLYGISFYTVTLAYLFKIKQLNKASCFIASNPLLLITGPIASSFKVLRYKSPTNRFNYYFPYIILGIFLYQIIAEPLKEVFFLKENTDLTSTIAFGLIFEIFVYCNFCGLSLIIYGIFGILGIRIPLNFKQPFSSTNLVEFWRGWHTSLSIVLKELFYLPLKRKLGANVAIFGVFLSSALWHGVSLNFLWWGLFHALCFSVTIVLLRSNIKYISSILLILALPFSRVLFSDDDIQRLNAKLLFKYEHLDALHSISSLGNHAKIALVFGFIFLLSEIIFRKNKMFLSKNYKFYRTPLVQFILIIFIFVFIRDSGISYAVYGQR